MFDAGLQQKWQQTDSGWVSELPTGWGQGRAVFGGLTAAYAVALAQRQVADHWQVRTMNVHLMRPAVAGALEGEARVVRQGKSATFVQVNLLQNGEDIASLTFVFARPRPDALKVQAPSVWQGPDPETLQELPYIPGVTPEFTQHVSMRWVTGGYPFSGSPEARFDGYCRYKVPAAGMEALIGMLDFWPCPSLSVMTDPAPASTVAWTAHVLALPQSFDGWFSFSYETMAGAEGFHTVAGRLYDPEGRLVGWTEQLVAVFG